MATGIQKGKIPKKGTIPYARILQDKNDKKKKLLNTICCRESAFEEETAFLVFTSITMEPVILVRDSTDHQKCFIKAEGLYLPANIHNAAAGQVGGNGTWAQATVINNEGEIVEEVWIHITLDRDGSRGGCFRLTQDGRRGRVPWPEIPPKVQELARLLHMGANFFVDVQEGPPAAARAQEGTSRYFQYAYVSSSCTAVYGPS